MISESKFQMWRATIAIVQVDSIISKEEKLWLDQHLKKIPFTDEQKETLKNDYHNGIKIDDQLFDSIEPRERGMLLSFANTIFKSDGLSKEEGLVLDDLTKRILGSLDMREIERGIVNIESKVDTEEKNILKKFVNLIASKV